MSRNATADRREWPVEATHHYIKTNQRDEKSTSTRFNDKLVSCQQQTFHYQRPVQC